MTLIKDLLAQKGTQVLTVSDTLTVLEATQKMNEHKIGALLVLQSQAGQAAPESDAANDAPRMVGMFTERDVLRRVVAAMRDPARTTVAEVMTTEVVICTPNTPVEEAALLMKDQRVRHLPVLDENGVLRGLISLGDINAHHVRDQELTIHTLHEYIHGRV